MAGSCKLCLSSALSVNNQIIGFGTILPSKFNDDGSHVPVKCTVAEVLIKHFWFEINSDNDADAFVCQPCWLKVDDFHQFYKSVLARYQNQQTMQNSSDVESYFLIDQKQEITDDRTLDKKHDVSNELSNIGDDGLWHQDVEDINEDADWGDTIKTESEPMSIKRNRERPPQSDIIRVESSNDNPLPPNILMPTERKRRRPPKCDIISVKSSNDNPLSPNIQKPEPSADAADVSDKMNDILVAQYFTLQCDLCSVPLANLQVARYHHQQVHKQRGYLMCGCGQRFVRDVSIREHCEFHADPSEHKCAECCKIFSSLNRLALHRRAKHQDRESPTAATTSDDVGVTPERNNKSSTKLNQQRSDDELMRRFMPMICDLCGETYTTFAESRLHLQQVHGESGYVTCCGKQFRSKNHAIMHCRWHANPSQFDCTVCGRNFASEVSLREHIARSHPSDQPFAYQCDQCERSFELSVLLRQHLQRKHTPDEAKRFECYRCHHRYVYMSQLRTHMRNAHDTHEPMYVCDACAKYFKSKATYELHYAMHHGTVSMRRQCPKCGKWLKHERYLKSHLKFKHPDGAASPTTVSCKECSYVAPNGRALYAHRRFSHCAPAYKCLVCDKQFKTKTVLREHAAVHTGVTDLYKCAYCPQTFRSNANMYKHRREKHGAEWEMDKRRSRVIVS